MKIYKISLLILVVIFTSCEKEQNLILEEELTGFFQKFDYEAKTRGYILDINNIDLEAYIDNIETRGILGQCKKYSDGSTEIIVDEPYWNRSNEKEKEYLIFHELGHCVLGRSHNNTKTNNGVCNSIMQSGEGYCIKEYTVTNREALLDELFAY